MKSEKKIIMDFIRHAKSSNSGIEIHGMEKYLENRVDDYLEEKNGKPIKMFFDPKWSEPKSMKINLNE